MPHDQLEGAVVAQYAGNLSRHGRADQVAAGMRDYPLVFCKTAIAHHR